MASLPTFSEKNKIARGLGISLPTEDGGHAYCLDNRLRRQTFIPQDLTKFQLSSSAPVAGMNLKAVPRDIEKRQFDLAVLGASRFPAGAETGTAISSLYHSLFWGCRASKRVGPSSCCYIIPSHPRQRGCYTSLIRSQRSSRRTNLRLCTAIAVRSMP